MMKKQKGFKTSPYFWALILVFVALGLYDCVVRPEIRFYPGASEWYVRSWLVAGVAALVFAAVIAWVDRYEREPWKWLLLALIWGAIVAPAINHQLQSVAHKNLQGDVERAVDAVDNLRITSEQRKSIVKEVASAVDAVDNLRITSEQRKSIIKEVVSAVDNLPITSEQRKPIVKEVVDTVRKNRITPFVEELCKGLFVFLLFLGVAHEFDDRVDGIVYGAMVGIGFGMGEQAYYLQKGVVEHGSKAFWEVFYQRIWLKGLWSHPMYTAFTGYGLGWARVTKSRWQRWTAPLVGFGFAVFLHTIWNSLNSIIIEASSFEQAVLVLNSPSAFIMVMLVLSAWRRERKVLAYLAEVPTEFASKDVMRSTRARWYAQWNAWRQGGLSLWQKVHQLQRTLMESAFLEWHIREGHVIDEERSEVVLEGYRSTVEDLVEQLNR